MPKVEVLGDTISFFVKLYSLNATQYLNFGYINLSQVFTQQEDSCKLCFIIVTGEGWVKKLPPKTHNWFIVASFCLVGLDRLVPGKCLTSYMWSRYIKKNHIISYAYFVDATMLHNAVSYDLRLWHLDLDRKVDNQGVYHHFVTGKYMSTLHFYQVCKRGKAVHDYKLKAGCFYYKQLYNSFTQNI